MSKIIIAAVTIAALSAIAASPASAMSAQKMQELTKLLQEQAIELMGPPPTDHPFHAFEPSKPGTDGIHCAGGTVVKSVHDNKLRGTFKRVFCK